MHYVTARFVHATHCTVEVAVFADIIKAQDTFRAWAKRPDTRDVTLHHRYN